jgi:hypothetical protein
LYDNQKGRMVYTTEVEGIYLDFNHIEGHSLSLYKNEPERVKVIKDYPSLPFVEENIFVGEFRGNPVNMFFYHPVLASLLAMTPSLLNKKKPKLRNRFFGGDAPAVQICGKYGLYGKISADKKVWAEHHPGVEVVENYTPEVIEAFLDDLEVYLKGNQVTLGKVRDHEENQVKVLTNTGTSLFNNFPEVKVTSATKNAKFDSLDDKL